MEEIFYFGDKVKIKKGIYKGYTGEVNQVMKNGLIGVMVFTDNGGKYIYFKKGDLKLIDSIFER